MPEFCPEVTTSHQKVSHVPHQHSSQILFTSATCNPQNLFGEAFLGGLRKDHLAGGGGVDQKHDAVHARCMFPLRHPSTPSLYIITLSSIQSLYAIANTLCCHFTPALSTPLHSTTVYQPP